MSKATKRKHVTREVLDDYVLPTEDQQIVKVVASKGNNLHEVETPSGLKYLASMPTKFRKNVWIKRGDFVIVDPIVEGDKVKGEITNILYKDQIKYIKEEKLWPPEFGAETKAESNYLIPDDMLPPSGDSDSDADNADVVCNVNRVRIEYSESEEESNSDEET